MSNFLDSTAKREARELELEQSQLTLKRAWDVLDSDEDRNNLDKLFDVLNKEWLFLRSDKEWLFNFQGGGWNSIHGADKEQAIKNAKAEWKNNSSLVVLVSTIRLKEKKEYELLLSSFD